MQQNPAQNKMKKYLLGGLFLIAVFIPFDTFGAVFDLTTNTTQSGQYWTTSGGGSPAAVYQSFQAPFNGTGTIFFWSNVSSGGIDADIFISNAQDTESQANALMLGSNNSICTNFPNNFLLATNVVGGTKAKYFGSFTYSLVQGKYYALCFRGNNGANQTANLFGSPSNDYIGGRASSSAGTVLDFALGFNPSSGSNIVNLVYPWNGASTTDFENWVVTYDFATSTTSGQMIVYYGQASSSLNLADSVTFSATGEPLPIVIQKSNPLLPIVPYNVSSTWFAQVGFIGINGVSVSSSIIQFEASTIGTAGLGTDPITLLAKPQPSNIIFLSASSSLQQDCGLTAIAGCFINAGVFLGNFFFRPSSFALDGMRSGIQQFETIFPFSLYFGVRDAVVDSINATSTLDSFSFTMPGFVYANTVTLGTIDSSTLLRAFTTTHCNASCAADTRDRLFLYVKMTLWIATAATTVRIITKA